MTGETALQSPASTTASANGSSGTGSEYDLVSLPTGVQPASGGYLSGILLRASVPVFILVLWWVSTALGWVRPQILSSPIKVAATFWAMLVNGELAAHLSASLTLAVAGLVIGLAAGLVLGVIAGLHHLGDQLVDPVLQMIRTVPFLAVVPLLVVWLGIGYQQKLVLIALAAGIPFYLNVHGGVRQADPKILEAWKVFGASQREVVGRFILPSALPQMLIGLRQALGSAVLALIVAEQTNTVRGIGFLAMYAQNLFRTDVLILCLVMYAVWGLLGDLLVRYLEVLLLPWRHKGDSR